MIGEQNRGGAGFFDAEGRYRGWASVVTRRDPVFSGLTVIDVVGADAVLIPFLTRLDRSRLVVEAPATGDTLFHFRWASGYENGNDVRIQGVLEAAGTASRGRPTGDSATRRRL
jgi:hypothetical protein